MSFRAYNTERWMRASLMPWVLGLPISWWLWRTQSIVWEQARYKTHIHCSRTFLDIIPWSLFLSLTLLILNPENLPPVLWTLIFWFCPRRAWSNRRLIILLLDRSQWAVKRFALLFERQRLFFDPPLRKIWWRGPIWWTIWFLWQHLNIFTLSRFNIINFLSI